MMFVTKATVDGTSLLVTSVLTPHIQYEEHSSQLRREDGSDCVLFIMFVHVSSSFIILLSSRHLQELASRFVTPCGYINLLHFHGCLPPASRLFLVLIWVFLKTVYIRNEQNVTDLHRLFMSCFMPFWV